MSTPRPKQLWNKAYGMALDAFGVEKPLVVLVGEEHYTRIASMEEKSLILKVGTQGVWHEHIITPGGKIVIKSPSGHKVVKRIKYSIVYFGQAQIFGSQLAPTIEQITRLDRVFIEDEKAKVIGVKLG